MVTAAISAPSKPSRVGQVACFLFTGYLRAFFCTELSELIINCGVPFLPELRLFFAKQVSFLHKQVSVHLASINKSNHVDVHI